MKQGAIWNIRFGSPGLIVAAIFLTAMLVAACSGGAAVPNHSAEMNPLKQCQQQNPGMSQAPQPPICSPPPTATPWDIVVTNPGNASLTSYPIGANGNATPMATLKGNNTGLNGNWGLYTDGVVNGALDVFAANSANNTVTRYNSHDLDAGKGGNLFPDGTLNSTLLHLPFGASENYTQSWNGDDVEYILNVPSAPATPSVTVFSENSTGGAPVWYSIAGNKTTLGNGVGIAIDSYSSQKNTAIYVSNPSAHKILMWQQSKQFPNPSQGQQINVAPQDTISGADITNPIGLYCDSNGYLYVVNRNPDKIVVYNPNWVGPTPAPSNRITDPQIINPYGVAVYTDYRVFVTSQGNGGNLSSIAVFNNGETGSSSRVQLVQGSATGLATPAAIDLRFPR